MPITEFLKNFIQNLPICEQIQKTALSELLSLPLMEHLNLSKIYLQSTLNSLETTICRENTKDLDQPISLKGVYICLADDASTLTVAGSLYFDEEDWAANADFYSDDYDLCDRISNIREQLDDALRDIIEEKYIEYIVFGYLAYLCYIYLPSLNLIEVMKNSGFSIGYSDGGEVTIGSYHNGVFVSNLIDIEVVGYSKKPNINDSIKLEYSSRGALWEYLHWNYEDVISEAELLGQFYKDGEEGARKITLLRDHADIRVKMTHRTR